MKTYIVSFAMTTALLLSACQTTSKQTRVFPLSIEVLKSFSLTAVKVNVLTDDDIKWPAYQKNRSLVQSGKAVTLKKKQAIQHGDDENGSQIVTQTFMNISLQELQQKMLKAPLETAFIQILGADMKGSQKVHAEIDLKFVQIPINRGTSKLIGDFKLKDAATNETLAERRFTNINYLPGGSSSSLDELIVKSAARFIVGSLKSKLTRDDRMDKLSVRYAALIRFWIAPLEKNN